MNPKSEPVAAGGTAILVLQAVFLVCAAFGHALTADQQAALTALIVLLVTIIQRQLVYAAHGLSPTTVASIQTDRAVAAAQTADPPKAA